jgi:hypothetical protein
MKRFLLLFFAVLLLIIAVPVHADIRGVSHPRYAAAHVKVRRVRVGGVVLVYDRAVKQIHVRRVKAWIRALPKIVRTSARHVYLLSRSHFRLTAYRGELADTYGYYIHPEKDIYLWPTSAGRLKYTLYHEYGHAFDSRVRLHQYSVSSAWRRLVRGDRVERFADVFADIWITLTAPAYKYIFDLLYQGG